MNLRLIFITLLLLLPLGVHAVEKVPKQKLVSQGRERSYYLYVPESTRTATAVPLVVLLHGSDKDGLSLVERWQDLASKEKFIIVGPDSSGSGWRMPQDGPEFIYELVEMLVKKYPIDSKRLYVFGHSAGAVFGLDLAMFESEYFAAVAVHAGSWRSRKEFTQIDLAKRKIPLKIIVGDRDQFFPMNSVEATEFALKNRQFPIEVMIMKGHTHWYYDVAAEINENAWTFLKQFSLTTDRRHAEYNSPGGARDANAALKQVNQLRLKADELSKHFYIQEDELNTKDRVKDRIAVAELVRAQVQILTDCENILRDAAEVADKATKLKLTAGPQQYFSLIALASNKRAEAFALARQRAEMVLSDEELNVINQKRDELVKRANALNDEAAELEKKAEKLLGG
jgi:predicted esterase